MLPLPITDLLVLPAACLSWSASRASGPGGQNVNKVSSKVELRFDLGGCDVIDPATKERLRALASGMLDAEGRILIVSQKTRDQPKNLDDAREKLKELVRQALVRPKKRRPTRPSRRAVARRLDEKSHASKKKRERSGGGERD
jgi:ribosome-associated protein